MRVPGAGRPAAATLSYAYAEGIVWLDDLAAEAHPMVHDLCGPHASSVRVPVGWQLRDHRSVTASQPASQTVLDLIGA